jgi:hypothetical protein
MPIREDVDGRVALLPHAPERAERWTLKQVQGDEEGFETVLFPTPSRTRHAELVSASIVPHARKALP